MRLHEEFGLSVSDDTIYRALKDLGFSHASARPKAYKQDADAMAAFKKTLPYAWRKSARPLSRVAVGAIAAFMAELRMREGVAARALEFTILTAARTGEVVGARWSEIDLNSHLGDPRSAHEVAPRPRVPLSPRAIELLSRLYREDGNQHFETSRRREVLAFAPR